MEIHPKVTRILTHHFMGDPIELYFIKGRKKAVIDTGIIHSPQDIAQALHALGLTLADIDLILNTHGHPDHSGGNAAIKAAGNAQLFIHRDDMTYVADHECYFRQVLAPAVEAIRGKEYLEEEKANFLESAGEEVAVDRQLEDNDLIDLGDGIELRVIHLQGHTAGSVGFYWEKEGMLFSGDSVSALHVEGGSLPIIWDLAEYEKSLERLERIPLRLLLSSHHYRCLTLPPGPIRREQEIKQYLRDCRKVAEAIGKATGRVTRLASGKQFMEIANDIIAELPKEMGFNKRMEEQRLSQQMTIFFCLGQANR